MKRTALALLLLAAATAACDGAAPTAAARAEAPTAGPSLSVADDTDAAVNAEFYHKVTLNGANRDVVAAGICDRVETYKLMY